VIKSSRKRWAGDVVHMERWEVRKIFWLESLKGREHSEDLGVEGRIVIKWILGKHCEKVWTGFIRFRSGTSGGLLWTR
jgi:hypothetical protein